MDAPEFVNREREVKELKVILSGRPNFVYFIYGPINSGKTALLTRVCEELPEDYLVFYINFRGLDVERIEDLIKVLFEVKYGKGKEAFKEIVKETVKEGGRVLKKKGIPIPEKLFDYLFESNRKTEDAFRYLESLFTEIFEKGKRPVLIMDELQVIKKVVNASGGPVLYRLFNFMVRLTKEVHLCHCLCATSDCLFIEEVYSNARLEGRAEYLLVDDLKKEEAFKVYEVFGFENLEVVWDYIGGKLGDVVRLLEKKNRGYKEEESLKRMLDDEVARLKWIKFKTLSERRDKTELWNTLSKFKDKEVIDKWKEEEFKRLLFWIEENVLFYNPVNLTVKPQSRLLWRAIKKVAK